MLQVSYQKRHTAYPSDMYRVTLEEAERQELHQRTHQRGLAPRTRERIEMVRLSDAGWSIPEIARHLGQGLPEQRL